jgi:hypothetical protein
MEPTPQVAGSSPADRPFAPGKSAKGKDAQRSRVANGSALLLGVDGRSAWVRRAKEIIAEHLSDLGGTDNTSAAERSIVRRASILTVELERLETKFAAAGEASAEELEIYSRIASSLRRMLETIGLSRRPRTIGAVAIYEPDPLRDEQRRRAREPA